MAIDPIIKQLLCSGAAVIDASNRFTDTVVRNESALPESYPAEKRSEELQEIKDRFKEMIEEVKEEASLAISAEPGELHPLPSFDEE